MKNCNFKFNSKIKDKFVKGATKLITRIIFVSATKIGEDVSNILNIVTRNNSLEIRTVELRFLLNYGNMLKSIAKARIECTAKQENKASCNTDYIVSNLIDFFGDD